MSDMYREILVKKETPVFKKVLKGMMIAVSALLIVGGMLIWPFLIAGAVLAVVTVVVTPKFDVEYEYLYVNGELDIDAIYSKQKRKRVGSYDMAELEILAPEKSHALDSYMNNKSMKLKDFSSGNSQAKCYVLIMNCDNERQCVKVEIDDVIVNDIRRIAPRKVNLY